MDPCPFVRLIIESLALKLPSSASRPAAGPGVHPTTTPCYAKLKLTNFPSQTALIPLCNADPSSSSPPESSTFATGFHLDPTTLRRLSSKPVIILKLSVFIGRMGRTCGVTCGKMLGSVRLCIDASGGQSRPKVYQKGWMNLGGSEVGNNPSTKLHVAVRSEPDPRYVFQFGGEPECSPVVFQIQENIRQPVFSCKFSADRNYRSR